MKVDSVFSLLSDPFRLGLASASGAYVNASIGADAARVGREFDPASDRDWCELVRDIAAVANSGGGRIDVGAALDKREVVRRLHLHIDDAFSDITIRPTDSSAAAASEILVGPATFPLGFSAAGVCGSSSHLLERVELFPAGTFYFRHGERSEPGTSADMRAFFERLLRRVRRRWLRGIRRVLYAPIEQAAKRTPKRAPANLQPVRIVTDPEAPALHPQDVDHLYPWRQKDLLRELNSRLGRRMLTTYDIQAVRRQHRLDERPEFIFNLPGAGRRYSPATADWIMEQFNGDPEFFHQARVADQAMLRLRRQKPR